MATAGYSRLEGRPVDRSLSSTLTIHRLAARSGVDDAVVRYYTRMGLLVPAITLANGYRRFDPFDVHRVRFIRAARRFGFTLVELRMFLDSRRRGSAGRSSIRKAFRRHVDDHEHIVRCMPNQYAAMKAALRRWDKMRAPAGTAPHARAFIVDVSRLEP